MSEDSSLVELDSSLESDIELYSDTSDEGGQGNSQKLQFYGESDQEASKHPLKWWQKLEKGSKYKPLSVQSGDIAPRHTHAHEHSEGNWCRRFCAVPKGIASAVFNFILKIVFFHKKAPVVSTILLVLNFGLFVTLVCTAIFVYPPEINISLRSFTIPNHPAQKHWDAFSAAKADRFINASTNLSALDQPRQGAELKRSVDHGVKKRSVGSNCIPNPGQRYQNIPMRYYDNWNLDLVYKVREDVEDKNLLTKERLSHIQKLENFIFRSPEYDKMCHKSSTGGCDRITSLMTSIYPTKADGSNVYAGDGFTPNLTATLLQFKDNPDQALWYTGGQITIVKSTNQIKAKLLRAQLSVGLPLPCFDGVRPLDVLDEQKQMVYAYYQSLIPHFEQASTGDVEVLYGGTALYDYQVENAQRHDELLAIASGLLVVVVIFILSGFSFWLTVVALYSVLSCFPWAYFVYRVILGIESLNVLNIISLFVVIGIGVDDVFVFINTFKQSSRLKSVTNIHQRLGYTILTAGKATFVTSLTTSVAFFANAISSIPAVKQFGVFMGLVVICCYFQVLVVLPLALHIWQTVFRYCENFTYSPCLLLCKCKRPRASEMPVRMSELEDEEVETRIEDKETGMEGSGITHENGDSDSLGDQDESTGLIPSSDLFSTTQDSNGHCDSEIQPPTENKLLGVVDLLSSYVQLAILHCIARPLMWFQLTRQFKVNQLRLDVFVKLTLVLLYVVVLVVSLGVVFGKLRFTDHPPQLFNSDTNIQKMLDLAGNLSESGGFTCTGGTGCGGGTLPYIPPPTETTPTAKPPTPSHSTPSHVTTPPTPPKTQPPPTTRATAHPPPTTRATTHPPPTTRATAHPPPTTRATAHPTHPPPTTQHTVATTTQGGDHTPSVTQPPTHKPTGGEEIDVVSSLYSNNLVVNVVFGVKDIKRLDTSTDFLSDGDYAVQEDSFYGNFTCRPKSDKIDLTGTLRALCRICMNISNPNNSLIMKGNFNCFPITTLSSTYFRCLYYTAQALPECQPLFRRDTSNVSVQAEARTFYNQTTHTNENIQYLAMAFRSTTSPNESPSNSIRDYQRWEKFLSEELSAIKQQSGPGEDYEGADQLLSAAFQTSGKWVEVNIEALAVDGSLYGICVSILLCLLIIVFLTYNWRLFFAIKFTVLNIIFSLLAMFVIFGWPLGIVEAITLTIVVGNSLDYCIHLCEGYMSATPDHIAYVEKFKFMSRASVRVKRVAASISFVGVSIVSSAITTVLATIPMLFTTIELFTRFGQILLLNTLLAITYTLVFCSTFLALFGPLDSKFTKKRALNAIITISTTVVVYPSVLFLLLYILSAVGVPILTAEGNPLFS